MLEDSERLMATVEQVLRAARTASTKPLLRTPVDLRIAVSESLAIARLRHHLPAEAIEFSDLAEGSAMILGETEEVKAAISNLVDNAVKYAGTGVHVSVALVETGPDHVAIRVSDNGPGIPQPELKRIFKRFYRIPNSLALRVKGTGLGLFIVRSVAERHGGRAWAESDGPGHGSTFVLEFPALRSATAQS
jgi:signal transduction histidine kinase